MRRLSLVVGVGPHFFTTLQGHLIAGREFTDRDRGEAPHVAIVNETYADRFFPRRSPVGQHLLASVGGAHHDLEILFELMTDFDEGFQEWRYRHIKLVERTIGAKKGTGGSLGVPFLKESLFKPIFPDLWAIRSQL